MFGRRTAGSVVPFPAEHAAPRADLPSPAEAGLAKAGRATSGVGLPPLAGDEAVARIISRAGMRAPSAIDPAEALELPRRTIAEAVSGEIDRAAGELGVSLPPRVRRDTTTQLVNDLVADARNRRPSSSAAAAPSASRQSIEAAKLAVEPILIERIDVAKASAMPRADLARQVETIVAEIVGEENLQLNLLEQRDLVTTLLNDMLGLGPLEPLLADDGITDIMVNGPNQVYVERGGRLVLTDVTFRDNAHVMNIATRIVSAVGRRIDETTPAVDARLADGSRVNIIAPPLAIDGPTISIRKFAKKKITMEIMERQANLSAQMATVLRIAARSRLNIVISGGTGSGKTTLLNALSRMIDAGERIVTIEDAAELQLQQPHVVRLETRPPNLEGSGEITQRDLVKNALRMRPDRIILGEIRAAEALDMLQAMNTGHDGSMCTVHANRPREALTRLENMVAMAGVKLPNEAVRAQIAGAVNLIVQIARMRDGVRRITHITEIVGMEGDVVTTQDLFNFEYEGEERDGRLTGAFRCSGLRPHFLPRAQYFGLDRALLEAMM